MELETVRLVADWLKDGTNGVNALLATTPRDAGDPVPGNVTVCDATRDGWVARKELAHEGGPTLPALAVYANPLEMDGEVHTVVRDATIDIMIAYVDLNAQSAAGNQDAMYTRRTILRSLTLFNANTNADGRKRNSIAVYGCDRIRLASLSDKWGDALVTAAVLVTFRVRDLAP